MEEQPDNRILKIAKRFRISYIFYFIVLLLVLRIVYNEAVYRYQRSHLENLSPKQIFNLYQKARWKEDSDVVNKLLHSSILLQQNRELTQIEKNAQAVETALRVVMAIRNRAYFENIVDSDTAEIGEVSYSLFWPFAKMRIGIVILTKEDNTWKIHRNKWDYGNMMNRVKENPADASLYYLCSLDIANDQNQLLAYRFRKRYYELDPEGFWVTRSFLERLQFDEERYEIQYEQYERRLHAEMMQYPPAWKSMKADHYIELASLFMFHGNNFKAEKYLQQAEKVFEKRKELGLLAERLDASWEEFRLRKEGKYVDPLEELEQLRLAQLNKE